MNNNLINTENLDNAQGEFVIRGIPSSPGIIMGKAQVIKQQNIYVRTKKILPENIKQEINRFKNAHNYLVSDYSAVIKKAGKESKNIIALLESNLMMLKDDFVIDQILSLIKNGNNSETAVVEVFEAIKRNMLNSKDSFLRDRTHEIDQIKHKLILTLRNQKDIIKATKGAVIVADFITSDEIIRLKEMGVAAIITEVGGITSHSAILARNFGIVNVIGVKKATEIMNNDDTLIVDGYSGIIIVHPSESSIAKYNEKKRTEDNYKKELGVLKDLPAKTADNREIKLKVNINLAEDIEIMQMVGADGVGLVRTEYLVISNGKFPDCEAQYSWYKKIADQVYPEPVTFRVFDIGSDKMAEGLPHHEDNPALGFRGIRFLLQRKDIFVEQIRAILMASSNKNVQILLPMITTLAELQKSKEIIEECKAELKAKDIPFDTDLPVGVMIETPAAALIACELAKHCDFFSVGTNDLTQYTIAADRSNELVSMHYDSFHPAVFRLIKMTVDAAKETNIPIGVCGELAGHMAATDILIGLGVDELSVAPAILLEIKKRIRELNYSDSVIKANELLKCKCIEEIKKKISL